MWSRFITGLLKRVVRCQSVECPLWHTFDTPKDISRVHLSRLFLIPSMSAMVRFGPVNVLVFGVGSCSLFANPLNQQVVSLWSYVPRLPPPLSPVGKVKVLGPQIRARRHLMWPYVTEGPHTGGEGVGFVEETNTTIQRGDRLGITLECRFHTLSDNEIKDVPSEAGIPAIPFPPTGLCCSGTEHRSGGKGAPSCSLSFFFSSLV